MSVLRIACLRASRVLPSVRRINSSALARKTSISHSKVLAENSALYELVTHDLKPGSVSEYWPLAEKHLTRVSESEQLPVSLVGSWSTLVGENTDQAHHILVYKDGYHGKMSALNSLNADPEWQSFQRDSGDLVNKRSSSLLFEFTFWPEIVPMNRGWIFELRTYILKSGSLIEWGQAWRQGIQHRGANSEAVHGWFAQIGHMHAVYHLWTYPDLVQRRETRQLAWMTPGWDDCVMNTVPLIRSMDTAILTPASFSPIK